MQIQLIAMQIDTSVWRCGGGNKSDAEHFLLLLRLVATFIVRVARDLQQHDSSVVVILWYVPYCILGNILAEFMLGSRSEQHRGQ